MHRLTAHKKSVRGRWWRLSWCPMVALVFFPLGSVTALAVDNARQSPAETRAPAKTRVIATTDGEIDDRCSMNRFLLYANEWEILGLVHSSSKFHWRGDQDHKENNWEPVEWLEKQLDAYEQVLQNLKLHDATYPAADYLRSQVYVGNIAFEGDMRAPSPGSERIVEVLLDRDDSPIWLQAWGGSNTIARALKTIQEEHPDRVEEVTRKARLFLIAEQDDTLRKYIVPQWPGLQVVFSNWSSFGAIAYHWQKSQPKALHAYFDRAWMTGHILARHGPLCGMYEAKEERFRSEGDTPAFLHVINTGLRSDEDPMHGGWGGRFVRKKGVWMSVDKKNSTQTHSILRWARAFQNDWAARADWCVKRFDEANHPPQVILDDGIDRKARAGSSIDLSAKQSHDPDGDLLAFHWWHFVEAGSCDQPVLIDRADQTEAVVAVPTEAEAGDTIHIICEVSDDGEPQLTRYQRVIITVKE
jgi:cellulose-binding protein